MRDERKAGSTDAGRATSRAADSGTLDYAGVFDAIPLPATLIDANGIVTDVNRAFLELAHAYGHAIRKEDRIGGHIASFARTEGERRCFRALVDELLRTGETQHLEWELEDSSGQRDFWHIRAKEIRDAAGGIAGGVVLRENITERKREELQRQALARVRDEIWNMQHSGDMDQVLTSVREALLASGVCFQYCSVNVLDGGADSGTPTAHAITRDGTVRRRAVSQLGMGLLLRIWSSQELSYRPDLEQNDPLNEREHLSLPLRSIVDVPFSHGALALSSGEPNAFSAADIEILQAMAQVLSEGFGRSADLENAEQRNRDLQAEVAERRHAEEELYKAYQWRDAENAVRLQIALIEEPGDLASVVAEASRQLSAVGVTFDSCTLQVFNTEGDDFVSLGRNRPPKAHPLWQGISWPSRGSNVQDYPWVAEVWRTKTPRYEPDAPEESRMPPGMSVLDVPFSHGTLAVNSQRPHAFCDAEMGYLQRIADVISDGFERFLDLVERRDLHVRQEAIGRMREAVWQMAAEDDLAYVLDVASTSLRDTGVPFRNCGINLVSTRGETPSVRFYDAELRSWAEGGPERGADVLLRIWREGQVAYRRDLYEEDLYEEAAQIARTLGHPIRSVLDAPFKQGTLAVSSPEPNAFSTRDIEILQAMAEVLSEGVQRQQDLQHLAQRNRELEAEIAERKRVEDSLQREYRLSDCDNAIRVAVASIDEPQDLERVLAEASRELVQLGVLHDEISLQIMNEEGSSFFSVVSQVGEGVDWNRSWDRWQCVVQDGVVSFRPPPDGGLTDRQLKERETVINTWKSGGIRYVPCTPDEPGPIPPGTSVVDVAFSHGTLAINRKQPNAFDAEDIVLLQRFAQIISQGFQRFLDIAERNHAEQALRESEERASAMVEAIPDLMFRLDGRGVFLDYRADRSDLYHQSEDALVGRRSRDITPLECADLIDRKIRDTLDSGEMQTFEYQLPVPGRGPLDYEARMVKSGDNEVTAIVRDTTERRKEQEALVRSSRLMALGEMAAGMAHELNQPLTVISTLAQGIEVRMSAGTSITQERMAAWGRDVQQAVERMVNLIEHMRTFARDHSQKPAEAMYLREAVRGALSMAQAQLKARGIELSLDLAEGLPPVMGHQYRLEQVVINLLHNARDAVEERREQMPPPERANCRMQIDLRTYHAEDSVVLEVEDNGTGMDEETRRRAMDPFYTTKGPDQGTGLGLSISHAIVKDHGGHLECQSQPGHGTVFRVGLPLAHQPSP